MLNELLLLSKNDIPFQAGQLIIHQPTIKEIAYIGEENFYMGCAFLNFSKEKFLSAQGKSNSIHQTDFQVLMSIVMANHTEEKMKLSIRNARFILNMLFPDYEIELTPNQINFTKGEDKGFINSLNFDLFKKLITELFCLKQTNEQEYNPTGGAIAQQMMEKFRKSREKIAKDRGPQKISIISRYVSILSVGEHRDMNSFMNYTIFQLFDEYERFMRKINFDHYVSAKMAGAKDIKEPENWTDDIHTQVKKKKE